MKSKVVLFLSALFFCAIASFKVYQTNENNRIIDQNIKAIAGSYEGCIYKTTKKCTLSGSTFDDYYKATWN